MVEFIVFGFAVGLLVGITGTGGGSVMTPLLVVLFGIDPATAIGTDIAYSAVEKSVGGVRQLRAGNVDTSLSRRMMLGSVPGAIAGTIILKHLEDSLGGSFDTVIFALLGGALLLTGGALAFRIFLGTRGRTHEEREHGDTSRESTIKAVVLGLFVGLVIGVTSAGSGALIAVGLIMIFRLKPSRVVGTDLAHASVVLWAAAIAHVFAGDIDYALAGQLLLGAIPGILISTPLSLRAPQGALRTALSVILLGAGLGLLTKAGVAIPSGVLAVPPIVVFAVVAVAVVRQARDARPGYAPA